MKLTFENNLSGDIDKFIGQPVELVYVLNSSIEITVKLPINWKMSELSGILLKTFVERPITVHVKSIDIDKSTLN